MDEKKNSWDDLLKQVGAAPPPDALERKRPAIETQFEPPPAPAPKAKPGDWSALVDELGVEVSEVVERSRRPDRPAAESLSATAEAMEASFAEIEPMESAFEEIMEEEITDVEFAEADDDFGREGESSAEEDSGTLSGDAARNAFEALFQAGSFSALPPLEKPARKPESRPGPQWREIDESRPADLDEDVADEAFTGDEDAATSEPRSSEDRERPRGRRRRRRGRGRGEREDGHRGVREPSDQGAEWSEAADEETAAGHEFADEVETEESEAIQKPPRRRRRRGRGGKALGADARQPGGVARNGRSAEASEEDDEDLDDSPLEGAGEDDEDASDIDDEVKRGSHKNIPTWSEAIGVMVETNLQSRKNAPQRPGPSRDRGRGRGRGRGGRGRHS